MSRVIPVALALVMLTGGVVVWFTGVANDGKAWAFIGPVLAGFGVALLVVTFQRRR